MSLSAFAPVDFTFQVANPPVAPADPASMTRCRIKEARARATEVLPTAFAVTLMTSPPVKTLGAKNTRTKPVTGFEQH